MQDWIYYSGDGGLLPNLALRGEEIQNKYVVDKHGCYVLWCIYLPAVYSSGHILSYTAASYG